MTITVAALFVYEAGAYLDMFLASTRGVRVDVWGKTRDARRYDGPHPVVAHPPCERWGRYWHGGPSARVRRVKGADGGCFAAALAAVRRCGGILEHPEGGGSFHTAEERQRAKASGRQRPVEVLGKYERAATPLAFRDLLIDTAATVHRAREMRRGSRRDA